MWKRYKQIVQRPHKHTHIETRKDSKRSQPIQYRKLSSKQCVAKSFSHWNGKHISFVSISTFVCVLKTSTGAQNKCNVKRVRLSKIGLKNDHSKWSIFNGTRKWIEILLSSRWKNLLPNDDNGRHGQNGVVNIMNWRKRKTPNRTFLFFFFIKLLRLKRRVLCTIFDNSKTNDYHFECVSKVYFLPSFFVRSFVRSSSFASTHISNCVYVTMSKNYFHHARLRITPVSQSYTYWMPLSKYSVEKSKIPILILI